MGNKGSSRSSSPGGNGRAGGSTQSDCGKKNAESERCSTEDGILRRGRRRWRQASLAGSQPGGEFIAILICPPSRWRMTYIQLHLTPTLTSENSHFVRPGKISKSIAPRMHPIASLVQQKNRKPRFNTPQPYTDITRTSTWKRNMLR